MTRMTSRLLMIGLTFVSFGWSTQVPSQNPMFRPAPGSPIPIGPGSGEVILTDVNGDGHLDMLSRHLEGRFVSVQLGDGSGHFQTAPGSPIGLGYMPGQMRVADLNNDRIPDLGVTNSDRHTVDIFLGTGQGGFNRAPGSPFTASAAVEFYTHSLDFVDINEDGKLDIVTANRRRNTFATLLGDGRGAFSPGPTTTFPPGHFYYSFTFGDIDRDGHLDVVIVSSSNGDNPEPGRVMIQRGDGKGNFKDAFGSAVSVSPGPREVVLADVNGDQRSDFVISHGSNTLSVLLNLGNGRFEPAPRSPYDLNTRGFGVVVADVNRDRRNDLLVATVDSVTVLLGDGGGVTQAPGSPFPAGPGAYNLAVGDLNEDGKLDIVASSFESKAVTVLLGR